MKQPATSIPRKKHSVSKSFFGEIRSNGLTYSMALPGIIFLVVFCYFPMYYMLAAFKDFNLRDGMAGSPWVGFENFKFMFSAGGKALQTTWNTILLNIFFIIFNTIFQLAIAIFVNEIRSKKFKSITQSMYFFPYFLSWIVIGEIVYNLFSSDYGAINQMLTSIGLDKIKFYQHPEYWRTIIIAANVWRSTGYGSLVYLATMSGFDTSYYEAAIVDGASKFQCIRKITLPMLKPTMIILILFSIGRIFFGDFGMIYGITHNLGPLLAKVGVIDNYVYNMFTVTRSVGMSVAAGLYQSVFGFIVTVVTNKLAKKLNDGSALF